MEKMGVPCNGVDLVNSKKKVVPRPGNFLIDTGLLFEINRMVLHPLGYALAMTVDAENNVLEFSIWDSHEDPEGLVFSKETFEQGRSKLYKFMRQQGDTALSHRIRILGNVTQLTGDVDGLSPSTEGSTGKENCGSTTEGSITDKHPAG